MANETVGTMKDRTAIITGGSRGLGRNTAVNLAGRGSMSLLLIARIRKRPTHSSAKSKRWEAKQRDFGSMLVTFTHLTDSWWMSARRCTVGGKIASTIW